MTAGELRHFLEQYIRTALWAETDGEEPLDENYGPADVSPECLAIMTRDCNDFQEKYGRYFQGRETDAAHDFWLTRNRHGAGFWDGDWEHGSLLTEASHSYGECELYVGDDGLIHCLGE